MEEHTAVLEVRDGKGRVVRRSIRPERKRGLGAIFTLREKGASKAFMQRSDHVSCAYLESIV